MDKFWASPLALEEAAAAKMAVASFGYYVSGADEQTTLADNLAAYKRWLLRPRMLVDVSSVSSACELFGASMSAPILVAPMAMHALAHAEGERASSAAAAKLGLGFCLSTLSTTAMEEVAAARRPGGAPQLFQLYVLRDRALTESLVRRAEAAGYSALVVTVDAPLLGNREADRRSRFALPEGLDFANLRARTELLRTEGDGGSALFRWFAAQVDASLTWADVAWLRSITALPVLLKGILTAEDALRALAAGAQGIVVSNHGGRQLDGVAASLDALPEVVAAVAGRVPVLVDGGVRRGTDVLKALALGARAVLVGRPVLYGLAVGGEEGAAAVLGALLRELSLAMALAGCASCASVGPWLVAPRCACCGNGGARGGGCHLPPPQIAKL